MVQLTFPEPDNPGGHPYLRVVTDYGSVDEGVSQARYVLVENGEEYIIKGPALTPQHRHVAANELIAAGLANLLGLPVLDSRIVDMNGQLFFASRWMQKPTFFPQITEDLFNRCENRERVYGLVVFDSWPCNVDRHARNLIVRVSREEGRSDRHLLLLNDHSHCLVRPGETSAVLKNWLDAPPGRFIRLDFLRNAITEARSLRAALGMTEAVGASQITDIVQRLPSEFLAADEHAAVVEFLLERRARLRAIFRDHRGIFANLRGGEL